MSRSRTASRIEAGRSQSILPFTRIAAAALLAATFATNPVAAFQAPAPNATPEEKLSPADQIVVAAEPLLKTSEWDKAIAECEKAFALEPKNARAFVLKGRALHGKGEFDNAIKEFDTMIALPGREAPMLMQRANAYAAKSLSLSSKGQYLPAIDAAYFGTLEKGDHVESHINRSHGYFGRKEYDKAINSLNRAINAEAKSAEAYSLRGVAYGSKGNYDQAIADETKAIEFDAQFAPAFQRRGLAHLAKGDVDKAIKDFDDAIKIKPNFADALLDRSEAYARKRDAGKAAADLDAALKADPKSSRAQMLLGVSQVAKGNFDQALKALDAAIALKPDNANAHSVRGYAHAGKNAHEDAVKDFDKAIELDEKLAAAYAGRSQAYRKLNKLREAKLDQDKAKELTAPPATVKKTDKKPSDKKEEETPRFHVKSKPVDPKKRAKALESAKQIDALVAANYKKHGIEPNPKTSDSQFVRRAYLDICGTIPTMPQTRKFMSAREADKRAALVDELLSSDLYAGHFYNFWADILRYTDNLNTNVRGEAYRQWIKQSLAESKPWNKMVDEMLTAEGLVWKNPASGYMQRDANMPLDNMNNTVRIFLGTRIGCAQCHDHPFDRWKQKEFYQTAAFTFPTLTSTGGGDTRYWNKNPNERLTEEYAEIEQEEFDRRQNSYRFNRLIGINMMIVNDQLGRKITLPKDYKYDDAKPGEVVEPKTLFGKPADLKPGEAPRKAFSRWLTSKDNPRFALTIANRLWKQVFGVGQIEPVDDMMDQTVAENPALMTFLESEMKRVDFDMKEYLRILLNTETWQREACFTEVEPGQAYHFQGPLLRRMTAEQVWDSFLTLAVTDPDEYRELPANLRNDAIGVDLMKISAPDLLAADDTSNTIDGGQGKRQAKYVYKGVLLARASELPSPVPANHFLRSFGQSDRELISASSTNGSVPQVLFMFNGPISHMLLEKNSTMYNNVVKTKTVEDGVRNIFRTILSRDPDPEEMDLAKKEVKEMGAAGYGNVIWSLVNTREFLFIQ